VNVKEKEPFLQALAGIVIVTGIDWPGDKEPISGLKVTPFTSLLTDQERLLWLPCLLLTVA
jgi:hypothetical protein